MRTEPKTILIADDEPYVPELLGFKLEQAGFDVVTACNGREALFRAEDVRPDAVVTDWEMPVMDGVSFARALRATEHGADVPVLLVTARGFRAGDEDLSDTNVREVVPKPFSPSDVVDMLIALVGDPGPQIAEAA